jgi:hypothetical protein
MEPRNYKIYSNGIHEIVTADDVKFMPVTGQTIFSLNGEVLHIAPASVMIANTDEQDAIVKRHKNAIWSIQQELNKLLDYREDLFKKHYPEAPLKTEFVGTESEKETIEFLRKSINTIVSIRDKFIQE